MVHHADSDAPRTVLILGGTAEARAFAKALAGRAGEAGGRALAITLSLAGRTRNPAPQPVPVRIGGFGGVVGLKRYLEDTRTDILVDATHPFATTISAHAEEAAKAAGVAHFAIRRPPWTPVAGDDWREAETVADAIRLAGDSPATIFVALGRQELQPLLAAPRHRYVIRSVDPVEPPLALRHVEYIEARGPFDEADETALFRRLGIGLVIAKNSGGTAAYAKLAAARALGLPVILIARPRQGDARAAGDVEAAVKLFDHLTGSSKRRGE